MSTAPIPLNAFRRQNTGMGNDLVLIAFEEWMLSTSRAEGTVRLRMHHLRHLARGVNLLTAEQVDLERYLRLHRDDAPETRKSWLSSMRVFYRWARRRGLIPVNPTLDIEAVHVPVRVPRVAADDAILDALARATDQQRAMILLARYACLRLTELTTLPVNAREGDMLRVRGKGDKERMVGINADLLAALVVIESQHPYYFPGLRGPHMHPQSVHKIIQRLTGYNPHSLRHAGATAAYRATHDLRAVQEMLGHASLATTQRYLHIDRDALRRVAAATAIARLPYAA